ncbi:MAG: T9SS type A sorting domain-containing protein [Flavobacteriales bacterium]|nr:T9SS type A sorting domain-containing protein [Flavobacteriales bacterium]
MRTPYPFKALLFAACAFPVAGLAQMDYWVASSFGSRFNDVNDNGTAISGGAYFDFATETWTFMEEEATEMVSINNNGDVAGSMYLDEPNFILQPAYKRNGTWSPIGWFPASNPQESSFTTYSISPNGIWVTGQMSIGCCDFGTFKYNTETNVLTEVFSPDYAAVAGYVITNDGTIGGWADDEGLNGGTRRIPVYITPELEIVQVSPVLPEFGVNAVNDINASSLMVGDLDGHAFVFDGSTETFTTFDIPADYETATFTSVSNNGVAVGYAQRFGEFGSLLRDAIVYHPSLGAQPVFLKDILLENGVDIAAPTGRMGTAYAISPNGDYVAGWDDQAPFSANGWVVYFDGLLISTGIATNADQGPIVSVFPNPTEEFLTISSPTDIERIMLFNAQGQMVAQQALRMRTGTMDLKRFASGLYTLRATTAQGTYERNVVKR